MTVPTKDGIGPQNEDKLVLQSLKRVCAWLLYFEVGPKELAVESNLPYATVKQLLVRDPEKPRLNNSFRRLARVTALQAQKYVSEAETSGRPEIRHDYNRLVHFLEKKGVTQPIDTITNLVCENFKDSAVSTSDVSLSEKYYVLRRFDRDRVCAINILNVDVENGEYVFYQTLLGRRFKTFTVGRVVSALNGIWFLCNVYGLSANENSPSDRSLKSSVLEDDNDYVNTSNMFGFECYSFSRWSLARDEFMASYSGVNGRGEPTHGNMLFVDASGSSGLAAKITSWLIEDFGNESAAPHGILVMQNESETGAENYTDHQPRVENGGSSRWGYLANDQKAIFDAITTTDGYN